jgi:hypothetical protein
LKSLNEIDIGDKVEARALVLGNLQKKLAESKRVILEALQCVPEGLNRRFVPELWVFTEQGVIVMYHVREVDM